MMGTLAKKVTIRGKSKGYSLTNVSCSLGFVIPKKVRSFMEMKMKIANELLHACPNAALLCFEFEADVKEGSTALWEEIDKVQIPKLEANYTTDTLSTHPQIKASRQAYKRAGKDPARYRVSSEALMRRILQEKGLYRVNNMVDCNNSISIQTGLSCGLYNLDKIEGDVIFRIGKTDEHYEGIGRGKLNIEGLPVFSDALGAFGSPTSDSVRTMVTLKAKRVLLVMISFSGEDVLNENTEIVQGYLKKYLNAKNILKTLARGEM